MTVESNGPAVYVITGVMAAGKSSVAQALAERLPVAAHVRGDVFRRMIVSGRAEVGNPLSEMAELQLALRHRIAAETAERFAAAGISAVVQDLFLGADLDRIIELITVRPLYVVALCPRVDVVAQREHDRPKSGYGEWRPEEFDAFFRADTARHGLWLDNSDLTVEATVDAILDRLPEARVR